MSNYADYVNKPNNKAYTHLTTCRCYIHRKPIDNSGYWREFATLKEADYFANSTGKKDVRHCDVA